MGEAFQLLVLLVFVAAMFLCGVVWSVVLPVIGLLYLCGFLT